MSAEKKKVQDSLQKLKESIELFYQQKDTEALNKFDGVLDEIMSVIDILFSYKKENEKFPLDENKIKETIAESMNALEERDYILLADIIQYDLIEYIEELSKEIE